MNRPGLQVLVTEIQHKGFKNRTLLNSLVCKQLGPDEFIWVAFPLPAHPRLPREVRAPHPALAV